MRIMKKAIILLSITLSTFLFSLTATAQLTNKETANLPPFITKHCELIVKEAASNTNVYLSDLTTNFFYKEFLDTYKESDPAFYNNNLPNFSIWKDAVLKEQYFFHPAYQKFPVLAISKENALNYCKWLETELQSKSPRLKYNVRLANKSELYFASSSQTTSTVTEHTSKNETDDSFEEGTNQEFKGPSTSLSFRVIVEVTT